MKLNLPAIGILGVGMLLLMVAYPGATNPLIPNQIFNVHDFGAVPNDEKSDVEAFQKAHDAIPEGQSGTIFVPAGRYVFDQPFNISKSNISILGEGIGSVIQRAPKKYVTLFQIPERFEAQRNPYLYPENVKIQKLRFDGNNVVGDDFARYGAMADIWVWQGKNIELNDLLLENNEYMGISVSNGSRPSEDVHIHNIRGNYFSWCLLHLGNVRRALVEDIFAYESPTQRYGSVSHTAIDVEVEGFQTLDHKPSEGIVDSVEIKNSLFLLPDNVTASAAISISPAYGPVRHVSMHDNFSRNYHAHLAVSGVPPRADNGFQWLTQDIKSTKNWMLSDNEHTWHNIATASSVDGMSFTGNVINDFGVLGQGFDISGGRNIDFSDNFLQAWIDRIYYCVFRVGPDASAAMDQEITVSNNKYLFYSDTRRPEEVCQEQINPLLANYHSFGHTFSGQSHDITPPTISAQIENRVGAAGQPGVVFQVEDTESEIARVVYLIDGIPRGFSNEPPYSLILDSSQISPGQHTIGSIAWDKRANISPEMVMNVEFKDNEIHPRPTPDPSNGVCNIPSLSKNHACAKDSPQAIVHFGNDPKKYFLTPACNIRLLSRDSITRSYCNGKLKKVKLARAQIRNFSAEKYVSDPKGKFLYGLDSKKQILRRAGKVAGRPEASFSRLSQQEFALYRIQ